MNIVHILPGKANPNRMNGVNKVVCEMATHQSLAGLTVELWGLTNDEQQNFEERVFKTVLFRKKRNPFALSRKFKQAVLTADSQTVFHLHGGWMPMYWAVVRFMHKQKRKVVLTTHGAYNTLVLKKGYWKKKLYYHVFESQVLKRIDRIHCLGLSEMKGLKALYPNSKSYLFPYGYTPNNGSEVNRSQSNFVLGFVGRLTMFTKGLDLLLEAFARFAKKHSGELWIVGDGQDRSYVKELADKLNISDQVVFHGSRFGEEKDELIKGMTAFVHPSRNEGLPTAVIEAASFGVPVVVSEATNLSSYVCDHKAGFAVENENVEALESSFSTLYQLWSANQLSSLQKNARSLVLNEFCWQTLLPKYRAFYSF